ncbi:MAG: hypothetical protein WD076_03810, partial [Parvularculaceae bacterium]
DRQPDDAPDDVASPCDDGEAACLSWLAEVLDRYEQGALSYFGDAAAPCFTEEMAAWRAKLDAECADAACREGAYRERIASLDRQQAGANADNRLADEYTAALVAVLGPETDAVEGAGAPLELVGDLVHAAANAEHMGLAVDTGAAAEHVLVFDLEIGSQPGHDALLDLLGGDAPPRVRARGFAVLAPDGVANFDTGRCRVVHSLPQ